jgi:hypothetical protein
LGFLKLADHGYEHRDYNSPRETGSTLCIRMTLTHPPVLARLLRRVDRLHELLKDHQRG